MSRSIRTTTLARTAPAALLALAGCASDLEPDWRRIDELDARLGPVETLEGTGGVTARATDAVSDEDDDGVARVESLLDLMRTGEPRPIGLAEVRRATIENNLSIQSALVDPEVAAQRLRAERAKFESTFVAGITRSRTVSPAFYGDDTIDTQTDSLTVRPGLEVPLRSGGRVTLDWTAGTTDYETPTLADQGFTGSLPGVSLQQPLLEGAGLGYNEASIVVAGAREGAADAEARLVVIEQVVRAEVAYWRLHLAWRTLRIDLDLYRVSKDLLETQRRLVASRVGSIANVYNFEVAVATAVQRVVASERALRQAVRALKVVMQDPTVSLDGSVALEPSSEPTLVGFEFDPRTLVTSALANRSELLKLEYRQLELQVAAMMRENEMLPTLDLVASWNANGFTNGSSIERANEALFGRDDPDAWSFGVNAGVPLGNEAAIAAYRAAVLERLRSIADRRRTEITVTQEVLDAIDALEAGWDSIVTADFRVRAAARFFESYQTLFDRGQIPSSNLTQALQALMTARVEKATVEVEYQIALANLAQATGCLLGHAAVEWAGDFDRARFEAPATSSPLDGLSSGPSSGTADRDDDATDDGPTLRDLLDARPPASEADDAADASPKDPG